MSFISVSHYFVAPASISASKSFCVMACLFKLTPFSSVGQKLITLDISFSYRVNKLQMVIITHRDTNLQYSHGTRAFGVNRITCFKIKD